MTEPRKLHKGLHTHCTLEILQTPPTQKAPISGAFAEPSAGLEPATPSLPWKFESVTRVHARAFAITFVLQISR
jgi:hypothetical protein